MRMLAIARNTFRESVRDKVLYVLLFFAAVTIVGSKALGWISIGQDIKIIKDITLAATSVFGALIAIFVGASLIYKEIDKRTLYTILARPMDRWEFIIGKYLGLMALLAVVVGVMTGVSVGYILLMGGPIDAVYLLAALLIYFKLMVVTALALLTSSLSSPILGAIIVFCFYVFGHATGVFKDLPPQFKDTVAEKVLHFVYYVVPNLANFDIRAEAANSVAVNPAYVAYVIAYGLGYSAILILLATIAFERKDI